MVFRAFPSEISLRFALAVVPLLLVFGCSGNSETQSIADLRPESIAVGSGSQYYFDSIASMVATSDLIVEAKAVDVERGRQVFDEDGTTPLQGLRDVKLEVSSVLKGQADSVIWIEEDGFDSLGQPYEVDGNPWSLVGDQGVYFVRKSGAPEQPADHYQVVSPDGRVLFSEGQTVTFGDSPMSASLREEKPQKVRGLIDAGIQQAEHDQMRPQAPWSVLNRPAAGEANPGRPRGLPRLDEPSDPGPTTPDLTTSTARPAPTVPSVPPVN